MEISLTIKARIYPSQSEAVSLKKTMEAYRQGCNYASQYVFNNNFELGQSKLNKALYHDLRDIFGLKSQMAQSVLRTVIARYKTVATQLSQKPYKCLGYKIKRDLTWLWKPITFSRPQFELVRNRDWSFKNDSQVSLNTLDGRIICQISMSGFEKYQDWQFGGARVLKSGKHWYLHISATKEVPDFQRDDVKRVVGIDRGLRFIEAVYDSDQETHFVSGKNILSKRRKFDSVRAQLQSRGTKSAKRALKRISGRENRWMADVNHQLSKALTTKYGSGTLFVLEDLEDVSTDESNFKSPQQAHDLRNWAFYDLETKLTYKAHESGSEVLKVDAHYTSQRCPRCGRIYKENRNHKMHAYQCDKCGFTTNDDRVGAMNIWLLGTLWVSGDDSPTFKTQAQGSV